MWGTFVRTVGINGSCVTLQIRQKVENVIPGLSARILVYSPSGECVYSKVTEMDADGNICVTADIAHALLWSPEQPHLYTADALLYNGDKLVDKVSSKFGIRTVSVSNDKGFQLNGVTRKLQGVCLHHDLGPLGAAVNKAAIIRQVKLMNDMGAYAIRTAHNMPSQLQMDVCDSLGMMVMAESFDMWVYPKCKNGYAWFFNDCAERDLENLVLANRNHASLIMYSIGNEIPEQWSKEGRDICGRLQQIIHNLDGSRPVTQGMDNAEAALKSGFAQVLDVPGFNYRVYKYDRNIIQLPKGFLLGSETASTVSSRGVYKFPVEWSNRKTWEDGDDLCFVTVSLVDKDGNEIPTADDNLTFEVTGAGHYRAACNGDATSLQPFTKPEMRLFSGKLVVVVQASDSPGTIILNVKDAAKGLSGSLAISVI